MYQKNRLEEKSSTFQNCQITMARDFGACGAAVGMHV